MKEQLEAIEALFNEWNLPKIILLYQESKKSWHLTLTCEHDYIQFKEGLSTLTGYQRIAQILGCTEGDEIDRDYRECGPPSCSYGSDYKVELWFW